MEKAVTLEYTQELDDQIRRIEDRDFKEEYESDEVIEKLNDPDFIRPFSMRLLAFYNEAAGSGFSADEAANDLLRRANKKDIHLTRNTIKNWFTGETEPIYGDGDRKNLYAVAFALELDTEKTERLFHKVFLDRAFNKRNAVEFIYLYCLKNGKPLSAADDLINKINNMEGTDISDEQTERSQSLADAVSGEISEYDLLTFIISHPKNFSYNNTAAKQYRINILDRLTGSASAPGLAQQEYERRRLEKLNDKNKVKSFEGKSPDSNDFLLYMIMDMDFSRKDNDDIVSVRDKLHRKEIYNQFPNKQTLRSPDPSSYILRKDIILLYFYEYWVSDFLSGMYAGNSQKFIEELNGILFECGFSPLYAGNPYDWLFLYCSICAAGKYTPLDKFRSIMAPE